MVNNEKQRVLLVDGDTIAFKSALAKNENGGDRKYDECIESIDSYLKWLQGSLFADRIIILLSDPKDNFRKLVYPPYKTHRNTKERPPIIDELKDYLRANYGAFHWPGLEADDVQGIIATLPQDPTEDPIEYIIISNDKDLRQIPGLLFNPDKADLGIQVITKEEGLKWTFQQALQGDATDGYPGIPGCGPKAALKVLDEAIALGVTGNDLWGYVLAYYRGKAFEDDYAYSQLWCARILQANDYDFTDNSVILWNPLSP